MIADKFNSEEELVKAYKQLEREFTKKSQELSQLKKEREESGKVSEDEASSMSDLMCLSQEENNLELSDENVLMGEQKIEDDLGSREEEKVETEPIVSPKIDKTDGDKSQLDVDFREKASRFLRSAPEVKAYSKEIAKVLLENKNLLNCDDPLSVAYSLVRGQEVIKNDGVCRKMQEEKDLSTNIINGLAGDNPIQPKVIDVAILSGRGLGSAPRGVRRRCATLEEAGEEVLKQYF